MQFRGPGGDWSRAPGPQAQRKREWENRRAGGKGEGEKGENRGRTRTGSLQVWLIVARQVPAWAKWWSWRPLPSHPLDRPSGSLFKYLTLYRSPPFTWTGRSRRVGVRARTNVGVHLPKFHRRCCKLLLSSRDSSSSGCLSP